MGRRRLGANGVKRGEIRWYTFRLPDKRRPVLLPTRNDVIDLTERDHRRTIDANNSGIDDRGSLDGG